jgi:hypothetical protein
MHRKVTFLHETRGNNYYIALQQISVDSMWRREVVWLQTGTHQYVLNTVNLFGLNFPPRKLHIEKKFHPAKRNEC